jgi:transcriptional regulator with XRE-family HTH domain
MGTRAVTKGPIAPRVAANIRALREDRRLTLDDLSNRLYALGRPIQRSGLSKIESGDRRVDTDDLVALALALDVTPNRLLLPGRSETEAEVELTAGARPVALPWNLAWRWACGEEVARSLTVEHLLANLDRDDDRAPGPVQLAREVVVRFSHENRPHDPTPPLYFDDVVANRPLLEEFASVVDRLGHAGVSIPAARAYAESARFMNDDGTWAGPTSTESD